MSQPSANGVDVDAGPKQMSSGCMPERVWTDDLVFKGRCLNGSFFDIALDQGMDAEAGDGLTAAIEEEVVCGGTSLDERADFTDGLRPERASAKFVAFASDHNSRMIPLGNMGKLEIRDGGLSRLIGASPGVIEEEQENMVTTLLKGRSQGGRQEGVHFRFFEVGDSRARGFFEGDSSDLAAPLKMFWTILADEVRQGTDGGQTLVAGRDSTAAGLFEVCEERLDPFSREILDAEMIDGFLRMTG